MVGLRRRVCRHDSRRAFPVGHCPHMYARIALTKTNATNAPARVRCPEVNKPKAAEPKNSTCITKRKSSGTGTAARRHEDAPDHRGQQRGAYAEAELPASPSPDPIIRVRPVPAEPQEPAETIRIDRPGVRRTIGG